VAVETRVGTMYRYLDTCDCARYRWSRAIEHRRLR
jgi:hypothetical protein